VELSIRGRHTLIYNITAEQLSWVKTLADLAQLKQEHPEFRPEYKHIIPLAEITTADPLWLLSRFDSSTLDIKCAVAINSSHSSGVKR